MASSGGYTPLMCTAMSLLKTPYCTPTQGASMPTFCVFGGESAILEIRTRESVTIAIMSATQKNCGYFGTVKRRTFPSLSSETLPVSCRLCFTNNVSNYDGSEFSEKDDLDGSWENGLSYECRSLLFKALHTLIEK